MTRSISKTASTRVLLREIEGLAARDRDRARLRRTAAESSALAARENRIRSMRADMLTDALGAGLSLGTSHILSRLKSESPELAEVLRGLDVAGADLDSAHQHLKQSRQTFAGLEVQAIGRADAQLARAQRQEEESE